jgi:hypothetical protein
LRQHILIATLVARVKGVAQAWWEDGMTVRGRLLVFGGVFATVILLVVVVAIVSGVGRNEVPDRGSLTPGERYLTDEFQPTFSFEAVGEKGWTPDFEAAHVLALGEGEEGVGLADKVGFADTAGFITFLNVKDFVVFDPSEPPGEADSRPAPKELTTWLQQHPHLQTEAPEPLRIGGAEGVYFDAVATDLPEGYGNSVCLLGAPEGEELCISPTDKIRFIVLEDMNGEPVTIMLQIRAVDFEEFLPRAQKVLETVEWEGA